MYREQYVLYRAIERANLFRIRLEFYYSNH